MSDIRNLMETLEDISEVERIDLGDTFDLELNEHFAIETGVVGFTEDGIILEADEQTLSFLEIHDIICESEELDERMIMGNSTDASSAGSYKLGEADMEESALQAYLGNKKYGKEGMDALRKAGREHASKEKMAKIRAKYDKLDEEGVDEDFDGTYGGHKIVAIKDTPKGKFLITRNKNDGKYELNKYVGPEGNFSGFPYKFISAHNTPEEVQAAFKKLTGVDESYDKLDEEQDELYGLKNGDDVRIIDGKFEGKEGHVIDMNHDTMELELLLHGPDAGRTITVDVRDTEAIPSLRENEPHDIERLDQNEWEDKVTEAEYQGRKVPLGKPMAGDVKKSKVYVRKPNGKVVKVNFGDKNMKIKKSNPKRRKSFRARHNCANPGPRWKARYWSCRAW